MNPEQHRPRRLRPSLRFLQRWLINTVAVMVAANIVRGISYESWPALLVASLTLGVLNALLRPLLLILSLPIVIFSLGLFVLFINAALLFFVGQLVKSFHVAGFWPAFWGGLIISIVTLVLNTVTRTGETRIDLQEPRRRRTPPDKPPDDGPVIDV